MTGTVTFTRATPSQPKLMTAGYEYMIPGMPLMGCGYDVISGRYAYSESRLGQLFDLTEEANADTDANYKQFQNDFDRKVVGLKPVIPTITKSGTTNISRGTSMQSVQKETSAKANVSGSYGGFSGQFEATAKASAARTQNSEFFSYNAVHPHYRLEFPDEIDMRAYLKPEVAQVLNEGTAEELTRFFNIYGGYYIHAGVFGGAIAYVMRTSMSEIEEASKVTATVSASCEYTVGKASAEASGSSASAVKSLQSNSDIVIETRGGADVSFHAGDSGPFERWTASIKDHIELIDFPSRRAAGRVISGLRPVWSLVADGLGDRAKVVEAAFGDYAAAAQRVWNDPDLKPIGVWHTGKTTKKSPKTMNRWYYHTNMGRKLREWWKGPSVAFHAFHSDHPGTHPIHSVRMDKTKTGTGLYRYELSPEKRDGWTTMMTFHAPTERPTQYPLDNWQPIFAHKFDSGQKANGLRYAPEGTLSSKWTKVGNDPVFYAVIG